MKEVFRRVSPNRAILDIVDFWRQPADHRWPALGVAAALTFCIFYFFVPENQRIVPARPNVIFISTWEEGRSQEEIMASNCESQIRQDEREALLARRAEIRQNLYSALGRATGMDVDEIAEQAQAEREQAEAEHAAAVAENSRLEEALAQIEYCEQHYG